MVVLCVPLALAAGMSTGGPVAQVFVPVPSFSAPRSVIVGDQSPVALPAVSVIVPPELWPIDPYPPEDEAPESVGRPAPPPDPLPWPGPGQGDDEES